MRHRSLPWKIMACGCACLLAAAAACGESSASRWARMQGEARAAVARISTEVEAIRGLELRQPVKVEVVTREQADDSLRELQRGEIGSAGLGAVQDALLLLGLLAPGVALQELMEQSPSSGLLGYYDFTGSGMFYLVGGYQSDWSSDMIVAHEICHALEDQHFGLGTFTDGIWTTFDSQFTRRAVFEGSATALMNHYLMDVVGEGVREARFDDLERGLRNYLDSLAPDDPDPDYPVAYGMAVYLAYVEGSKFVTRNLFGYGVPGAEQWNRIWLDPPRSSEQILHPEKYWDAAARDEPLAVDLPDLREALGDGWVLAADDVLGELWTGFVLAYEIPPISEIQYGAAVRWSTPASEGWGGDRFHLYRGPAGERLLVWASAWDSAADREEFLDALLEVHQARNKGLRLVHAGEGAAEHLVLAVFADEAGAGLAEGARESLLALRPEWR